MIYKPVDAYPNNGIFINAESYNEFEVTVQGSSSRVNAYQIFIYDAENFELVSADEQPNPLSKIYVSGETIKIPVLRDTLENNRSYYWVVRLFQSNPDMFISKTRVNSQISTNVFKTSLLNGVKKGMYVEYQGNYYEIIDFSSDTEVSPATSTITIDGELIGLTNQYISIYSKYVDSIEFPFYTAYRISVFFPEDTPTIVTSRTQEFKMETSSETGIKWYRYVLKDEDGNLIDDTDKIYNSLLTYKFDGFVSDKNYNIKGYICDSNNITISTDDYNFFVEYNAPDLNLPANVSVDYENDAIKISWVDDAYSVGKVNAEYSYVDSPIEGKQELQINQGTITYDSISGYPLNTGEEFTIFTDVEFDESKRGKIIELLQKKGNYYIYVQENNMYVVDDDVIILTKKVKSDERSFLQESPTAENNVAYVWNDDEVWDDNKYWIESLPFTARFKITILANETLIEEVE